MTTAHVKNVRDDEARQNSIIIILFIINQYFVAIAKELYIKILLFYVKYGKIKILI